MPFVSEELLNLASHHMSLKEKLKTTERRRMQGFVIFVSFEMVFGNSRTLHHIICHLLL